MDWNCFSTTLKKLWPYWHYKVNICLFQNWRGSTSQIIFYSQLVFDFMRFPSKWFFGVKQDTVKQSRSRIQPCSTDWKHSFNNFFFYLQAHNSENSKINETDQNFIYYNQVTQVYYIWTHQPTFGASESICHRNLHALWFMLLLWVVLITATAFFLVYPLFIYLTATLAECCCSAYI